MFKINILLLLYLFVLSLSVGVSYGQIKCKIEHYSTEDGLSQDGVMSMIKDHEGFMWFGTWDGINRFDGHHFITYKARPGDNSNLKNNRIDNIVEDKSGYLWIKSYDNQVYRFDKKSERFLAVADLCADKKLKNATFDKITPSANGGVWITTTDQGVIYIAQSYPPQPPIEHFSKGLSKKFNLPSNHIKFLHEDSQNNVWIGTSEGLVCLTKNNSGNYAAAKDSQYLKYKFTCTVDGKDRVWFGTGEGDLIWYQQATGKFNSKKITDHSINAIALSRNKKSIFCSTSASELITVNIKDLKFSSDIMTGSTPFYSIHEDKTGLIWIEPQKHGIIKYDPSTKLFRYFYQKNDASFYNPVKAYSVFEDNNGIVWIRMKGGGFGYYDPREDKINYFFDEPGSPDRQFSNIVTCKYLDPAGILWLSTNDRGINKIIFQRHDFAQQTLVQNTADKSDNDIRGIFNDSKGRLWLASKSGKLFVDHNGKHLDDLFVNLPAAGLGVIYTIIQDRTGAIWLGTKGNGLFKAEPINSDQTKFKLSHFLAEDSGAGAVSSNLIYSVFEDKAGRIWIGTYEHGLNLVVKEGEKTKFINCKTAFKNYPKDSFNKVRHLQQDAAGNLWVATTDGLLIVDINHSDLHNYRIATFHKIKGDKQSLGNNNIQFIYRDNQNAMWLSTSGGGLNKAIFRDPFKSLKFKVFTTEDGLPNDYVLSTINDNDGNLWVATEKGLSEYNPQKNNFRNYDSYDGLPKAGFSEASNLKLPNGRLVFGCTNGYISFDPGVIKNQKIAAVMAFTNLQVNNKDVSPGESGSLLKANINSTKNILLNYNQNIISIDYAVLDYRSNNKQAYAYRLKGFDTAWHSNNSQLRATYTNLPPGSYTFEVESLNSDIYLKTPYKSLAITIMPPYWRTWWAYCLYFIFAIVLIETVRRVALTMLTLRHRIAVEQRITDLKLSFFTNISHELRTPLTLILNPIEEIFKKEQLSAQGNEYINVVRKNANRMVRFINQLLDLRKMQSGKATLTLARVEMIAFVKQINSYFTDVAHEKNITVIITSTVEEVYAWIDADKIDIVIYNLFANAFKFSPEGKTITVQIKPTQNNSFTLEMIDQGTGVSEGELDNIFELYYEAPKTDGKHLKGTGIGLALSKEFVGLHHGHISAKNNQNKGLTVTVELLSGKAHFENDNVIYSSPETAVTETNDSSLDTVLNIPTPTLIREDQSLPLILLVEDNAELRKILVAQLGAIYRIEEAENGEDGLEKALRLLPDLILSDVMMPKMDGIQMLDILKGNLKTSHIPVILLTARYSVENQIEGLQYGADGYITKPFLNDILMASIDNLLRQRKMLFESLLMPEKKVIKLGPDEVIITSKDEVFLKKIIKIVEEQMADPEFNIDTVAGSIGMGRTTFYKKFKSLTDVAPVEFVRDMRLSRSKQLLDAGENNVSEIGYTVGFNSAGYFGKCFKEKYGVSPSEYLKTANANRTVKV